HGQDPGVLPGERLRGQRRRGGGTHGGDVRTVHDGQGRARLGIEEGDEGLDGGHAGLGVGGEDGHQLGGEDPVEEARHGGEETPIAGGGGHAWWGRYVAGA